MKMSELEIIKLIHVILSFMGKFSHLSSATFLLPVCDGLNDNKLKVLKLLPLYG